MKTIRKIALVGTLGMLAASAAIAQPADNDRPPRRQGQGGPGSFRPDPEMRKQALLGKYDANKDGKLDDTERAAIGKDVEEGTFDPRLLGPRPDGPRFGRGPGGPQGGPGFGPRHEEMLEKYDANKDGRIDAEERAVIHKDIQEGRLERPRPGRRGFGPPPGENGPDGPPPSE